MNIESEAIKVLAESLIKAYGNVIEQNNRTYVNNQIKNNPGGGSGGYTGSIGASQIRGLGTAVLGTVSTGIQDGTIATFYDGVIRAVAAEFETAVIGTAMIDNVFARYGEFTKLVAEKAKIQEIDTEEIYADLATISSATIDNATIRAAQISISSTDTAFIREGLGGKYYIDNLAVTDANIISLSAGEILLNDNNGFLVRLVVEDGVVTTEPVSYDGDDIINESSLNGGKIEDNSLDGVKVINGTVSGSKLIANTITTRELNVSELFAQNAVIMDLIASNIDAVKLFANEGFIPNLTTTIIQSAAIGEGLDLSNNSSITLTNDRIESLVSNNNKKTATYVQIDPPEDANAGDVWFNPASSDYWVAKGAVGRNAPIFAYDDNGNLLYSFRDEATETYDLTVDANGYLNIDDPDGGTYTIENDELKGNVVWERTVNQAFSQVTQTADKINWIVANGTSASNMTLTSEALTAIANNIDLTANESIRLAAQTIAIETVNTLVRVDSSGLHVGESGSNRELLIDNEALNVNVGGETYSKFGANYAQFGNYRIYNDSTGGLVFKMM